jgi:hypothetical protein
MLQRLKGILPRICHLEKFLAALLLSPDAQGHFKVDEAFNSCTTQLSLKAFYFTPALGESSDESLCPCQISSSPHAGSLSGKEAQASRILQAF